MNKSFKVLHTPRYLRFELFVILSMLLSILVPQFPAPVLAAGTNCVTSAPPSASYTVTPCIDPALDGITITGNRTITGTYSTTGANPGVAKLIFYLTQNGLPTNYLITDYGTPYTFTLPSNKFVDGTYSLAVAALMKDGFTSQLSSVTVTLSNGVTTPPVNNNTFTPTTGTTPAPGQPFTLVTAGDGADGATNSGNVTNLINSWNPNLFLYVGDVYEKGTATEFYNWYGQASTFYGRFRPITDPIIGNHEYENGVAPGYFDYWDNVPNYYSYEAAGWHFIALNSNCGLLHICDPGQAEYQWLLNDLNTHNNICTIAYFHHPVFNAGPEGYTTTMNNMWALMAQHGVDIVLTGHDHDYQRWMPLDANGNPSSTGMTQFVAGTGGHGIQQFTPAGLADSRMVVGYDSSPLAFGALRLQLNNNGAGYQFINSTGLTLDSGAIPCSGAPTDVTTPSTPANLTATTHSATQADLSWGGSIDNVGITGYDIYRDGNLLTSVGYVTSYSDTNLTMGATYSYQVKARDASGNTSAFSNMATVTMPLVLFSDGFESGDLLAWSNTNLVAQQQEVYAGVYSARETKTSGVTTLTFATKNISPTLSDLYYSLRFKIISKGANSAYLQRFRTSSNGAILGVFVSSTGRLMYRNDTTSSNSATGPIVSNTVWHDLQTHIHIDPINPANGQIEIWLDGGLVGALSTSASLGTNQIGIVQLGDNSGTSGATYDVALDEVAVSTSFINTADSQSPSTPTGLSATPTTPNSPNSVDLTWNASTDNISVTGYDLYRNGAPLTTLGVVTNYTDTPVSPAFTYQYQVLARDAAGNTSALSAISPAATVTTPADTTPPIVTLTAPADGISVSANVTLSADATDDVGFQGVDFLVNGTVVGTVAEGGPYIITWDSTTVPDGPVTITARAVDTSLNETTSSSRTITVNNAGGDTTPPTVPANLAATAAGSSQVNLSWNPSNDNVAVTGYDIYRDGALLMGIGAMSSYSDTSVVIGATYQYQVLARDAAGNFSALTSAASVTVPDVLFKDGFESGDLSQWTNNGLNIQQQSVLEGIYAAHGASNGSAASYAYKQLSTTHNDLYYSTWFKLASQGATSAYVQRFRTSTNGAILGVFVSSTGRLMYRNDVTSSNSPTGPILGSGVWSQIQTHVHMNGASSQVEIWLNGVKVSALSNTLDLGPALIGRVQLGDSTAADIYDVVFDEVAFDTSFIQSSNAPHTLIDSGPLGIVNSNSASFSFSATVAGAMVAGATFQCSLDGAAFSGCTSPQAFAGLADGAHTFAVQATDTSANADPTPATRTWTVDTTAPIVTSILPVDTAIDIATTSTASATFSEAMNAASLMADSLTLVLQSDGTPIPATLMYDMATKTLTLYPTSPLAYSSTYVATVKGGAGGMTDLAGNSQAADTVWSFTTISADAIAPTITLTSPSDGATVSGIVSLTADATDNTAIDHVDFLVNGAVVGTVTSASSGFTYSFNWNSTTLPNGPVAISAQAVDIYDNSAVSSIHNVTIDNDVTPPSAPTNLTAHAVSSGQVDLTWMAATDDVGVTGYDIYRDGAQLATVGAVTSYSDTTTDPATTYSYQVLARDAAGHPSNFSTAATATTPAALFSDGFESGDLSNWSVVNGLVVQQQDVHAGVYDARATTSGPAANANKLLGTARYELYYTTWFKILSADPNNSVYLQRFIKADTFSALGVFVSKTGKLGYRNDISGFSNTSAINVSSGWHQIKTHIQIDAAGGPGQVDVWFDGVLVAGLSQAESLGNAPIARIQLGDNSTTPRIYDVAFDDVTVTLPADLALPSVTLTAPVDGALLHGNVSLTATASDNVAVDHVDFLVNGNVVSTDTSSPYGFDWNSASVPDGPATITATAVDTSSNSTSSSVTVTLDNTPPDTAITSKPLAITTSTTANFSFTKNDTTATLSCSLDGAAFTACTSPTSYTALTNGQHTFQVSATDPAGNVDPTPASYTWTVDTVAPTVSSTLPTTNANNVPPITTVVANFSEALNPATITNSTFTVRKKQGGSPVSAIVTYDAATHKATLQPSSNLAAQTAYTATITGGASGVKDLAGNPLGSTYSWNFTTSILDTTPPTVTLTAPTNGAKVHGSITLSANASDNVVVASVSFLVNGAVVGTDTTSPYSVTWNSASITDGTVTVAARAVDPSNNATATANISVTVDNTPPNTTITSGPTGTVASTSASFSFTATETATFACSLDGAAFTACSSPASYTGLAGGAHTFQVRATDTAGNIDATPASQSWTVIVPPDTTITAGPSGTVTTTSASFSFTSTIGGSTFTCSLDGSVFSACTSPKSYANLTNGSHTFQVAATAQGLTDPTPASRTWTINLAPDTSITAGPSGTVTTTSASFSFTSTIGGSSFTCSLDGAAFSACTSPKSYTNLTNGSHTFQVAAISQGVTDPTPASRTWTIDLAPDTTISAGPTGNVSSTSASFSFTATVGGSTFTCSLDGSAFSACTSPKSYTGLTNGSHTFQVAGISQGVTDPTPASRTWTVDTVAPTGVAITAPANGANVTGQVTINATASDTVGVVSVSFYVDGQLLATDSSSPYSTNWNTNKVSNTTHTLYVRAVDAAGNVTQSATITVTVH